MSIHIRELHIKLVVNSAASPPSSTEGNAVPNQTTGGSGGDTDKELIIAECVEQVMAILRDKLEK